MALYRSAASSPKFDADLDFEKIRLSYSVQVKFELK
jgi:hypothetical protein